MMIMMNTLGFVRSYWAVKCHQQNFESVCNNKERTNTYSSRYKEIKHSRLQESSQELLTNEEHGITEAIWPDLNWFEHIWPEIFRRLNRFNNLQTLKNLTFRLQGICKATLQQFITNLFVSLSNSVTALKQARNVAPKCFQETAIISKIHFSKIKKWSNSHFDVFSNYKNENDF